MMNDLCIAACLHYIEQSADNMKWADGIRSSHFELISSLISIIISPTKTVTPRDKQNGEIRLGISSKSASRVENATVNYDLGKT
jgi:hypothetical protein